MGISIAVKHLPCVVLSIRHPYRLRYNGIHRYCAQIELQWQQPDRYALNIYWILKTITASDPSTRPFNPGFLNWGVEKVHKGRAGMQ